MIINFASGLNYDVSKDFVTFDNSIFYSGRSKAVLWPSYWET